MDRADSWQQNPSIGTDTIQVHGTVEKDMLLEVQEDLGSWSGIKALVNGGCCGCCGSMDSSLARLVP